MDKKCAQRKKTLCKLKQNDASISCGTSPQWSTYLNIGVRSKLKIKVLI